MALNLRWRKTRSTKNSEFSIRLNKNSFCHKNSMIITPTLIDICHTDV
ncbi:hypothetical protein ACQCN2_18430 [Brevibacillus ginsengisoli]